MSADPGQDKIINVTSSTSDIWMERDPKQMFDLSSYISEEEYNNRYKNQEMSCIMICLRSGPISGVFKYTSKNTFGFIGIGRLNFV